MKEFVRKNKIIICGTALFILLTILFGVKKAYVFNEIKSISEYFWGNTDEKIAHLMKEYNQTVEIDDYTITLESALLEDKIGTIYGRFRVSGNGSWVKSYIYHGDSMWKAFGEDTRFSLLVNADAGEEGKYYGVYDGADLIIYCKFQYYCGETEDTHEIYLIDKKTGKTTYENCAAGFTLEPASNAVEIKCSSTREIYISPFAVKISSKTDLNPRTIEICYKNGETQEILNAKENVSDEDRIMTVFDSAAYIKIIEASELIDLEQVEGIMYNGEMYYLENGSN